MIRAAGAFVLAVPRPGVLALAAVALAWGTGGVRARTMQQRLEQVCAGPIDALCAQARPDGDKINACLASHRAELPPDCAKLVDIAD